MSRSGDGEGASGLAYGAKMLGLARHDLAGEGSKRATGLWWVVVIVVAAVVGGTCLLIVVVVVGVGEGGLLAGLVNGG